MKRNFLDFTEIEKANFTPVLYMIMGKSSTASDGWEPMIWSPEWRDENTDEVLAGQLAWADSQVGCEYTTPFDLYDLDTAKKHILEDCLFRGMRATEDPNMKPLLYRIAPVYTGLEHLLQPRVMIFCESPNGTVAPCMEWPEDCMDDKESMPLCHLFSFRFSRIDEDNKDYTVPVYAPDKAKALIDEQLSILNGRDDKRWRYFTIPVSI